MTGGKINYAAAARAIASPGASAEASTRWAVVVLGASALVAAGLAFTVLAPYPPPVDVAAGVERSRGAW